MTLEQQLASLEAMGLPLAEGVTVDDLLYSFDRAEYEARPFDLLLFMLGGEVEREPWGRVICDRVWSLDTECIEGPGSYVSIIDNLCRIAGARDRVTGVRDHVDLDSGEAWIAYTCDGKERRWDVDVQDDWADTLALSYVMDDLETGGHRFYSHDSGQTMVLFYLDEPTAARLGELSGAALEPVNPA